MYQRLTVSYTPEELKVQAGLGQEELIVLLEPHLAHSSVLEEMNSSFHIHVMIREEQRHDGNKLY